MPVRLSDVAQITKTIPCALPGVEERLSITYRPNAYTPLTEAAFRAAIKDDHPSEGVVQALCAVLARWDLQEDDGAMIAITPERLRQIGTKLLSPVMTAIVEDMRDDPTTPATSLAS